MNTSYEIELRIAAYRYLQGTCTSLGIEEFDVSREELQTMCTDDLDFLCSGMMYKLGLIQQR